MCDERSMYRMSNCFKKTQLNFYYQYTKQSIVMQTVGSFDHVNARWTVSVSLCIVNSKSLSLNITQIQQTICTLLSYPFVKLTFGLREFLQFWKSSLKEMMNWIQIWITTKKTFIVLQLVLNYLCANHSEP